MKIISLTVLLYGKSYLGWSLKSVLPYVDEVWVLYSAIGSHGFRTSIPCPETRDELYAIASAVAGDKLRWFDGTWPTEGSQRDAIYQLVPDADVVIVVDSDEVYPTGLVPELIEQTAHLGKRAIRVPFIHMWRSFYRAILHDPSYPVRVIYPQIADGEDTAHTRPVVHFGYAQPAYITEYKILTHGHRGQWREGWFDNIFMDETRRNDLHPVGSDAWNWEVIDPWQYMPAFMKQHPFAQMRVIP